MSVPGIDVFRDYMKDQEENYAIIGGSACDLIFANVGVAYRSKQRRIWILMLAKAQASTLIPTWRRRVRFVW
jgi:hypothetical protein